MTDLLTPDERNLIDGVERGRYKGMPADLVIIIRSLNQRARIAIRDEKFKWRNLLVDWIEEVENGESELDEKTLRYIYEKVVAEHEFPDD